MSTQITDPNATLGQLFKPATEPQFGSANMYMPSRDVLPPIMRHSGAYGLQGALQGLAAGSRSNNALGLGLGAILGLIGGLRQSKQQYNNAMNEREMMLNYIMQNNDKYGNASDENAKLLEMQQRLLPQSMGSQFTGNINFRNMHDLAQQQQALGMTEKGITAAEKQLSNAITNPLVQNQFMQSPAVSVMGTNTMPSTMQTPLPQQGTYAYPAGTQQAPMSGPQGVPTGQVPVQQSIGEDGTPRLKASIEEQIQPPALPPEPPVDYAQMPYVQHYPMATPMPQYDSQLAWQDVQNNPYAHVDPQTIINAREAGNQTAKLGPDIGLTTAKTTESGTASDLNKARTEGQKLTNPMIQPRIKSEIYRNTHPGSSGRPITDPEILAHLTPEQRMAYKKGAPLNVVLNTVGEYDQSGRLTRVYDKTTGQPLDFSDEGGMYHNITSMERDFKDFNNAIKAAKSSKK
jgi:hypothetical protein